MPENETKTDEMTVRDETYVMRFSQAELRALFRRRTVCYAVLFGLGVYWTLLGWWDSPEISGFVGFWLGLSVVFSIWALVQLIRHLCAVKKLLPRVLQSEYTYEVRGDRLHITIRGDDGRVSEEERALGDIGKIYSAGAILQFELSGHLYLLRKADLAEDTRLFAHLRQGTKPNTKPKDAESGSQAVSVILILLSIMAPAMGSALAKAIAGSISDYISSDRYMWVTLLMLPLPLTSVVAGFVFKKCWVTWKVNVVVGIVMAVIVTGNCVMSLAMPEVDEEFMARSDLNFAEFYIDVEFPEMQNFEVRDAAQIENPAELDMDRVYVITFAEEDAAAFEATMDSRWLSEFPADCAPIPHISMPGETVGLLYNITTEDFNQYPTRRHSKHRMMLLSYCESTNQMAIVWFTPKK